MEATIEDRFWQAIVARNPEVDGEFYYGVVTTGVYCRPSCASRQPLRENVVVFELPALAEQAGFRPCKRCRPRQSAPLDGRARLVQAICNHIEQNLDAPDRLTLEAIGAAVGYAPDYAHQVFRTVLRLTPRQYADARRIDVLRHTLRAGDSVSDGIYAAGFSSLSRVYERASAAIGMTPAAYRQGAPGVAISYTVSPCSLGWLLVGLTGRGVCAVGLYDTPEAAATAMHAEYPHAMIERDDEGLKAAVEGIIRAVEGSGPTPDLPLDIRATAFQRLVWEALRQIPRGETRSYAAIAQAIGQPDAARAVAHACASNPAAILIPCHRAVGKDGSLRGYRWGLERKRRLLEQEAAPID